MAGQAEEERQLTSVRSAINNIMQKMNKSIKNFTPGQLSEHISEWKKLTSCKETLSTISGLKLEFSEDFIPNIRQKPNQFSKSEQPLVEVEINKLLKKGVVVESVHEQDEIISPIFIRPKPDGCRLILNLKETNTYLDKVHFKMETLQSILNLIRPDCYMASIDLKDAYYSVKMDKNHQKYLKFQYNGKLYHFVCLPNGLTHGPRKFTKITKAPLAYLRQLAYTIAGYIDDFLNVEDSIELCLKNLYETIKLLAALGFIIHPTKSMLDPSKIIIFLGFIINSELMIVQITFEKSMKVIELCTKAIQNRLHTIRFIAKLVGTLISTFPAVKYGPLYYRNIDMCKNRALACNQGSYSAMMTLDEKSKDELSWWINNITGSSKEIFSHAPSIDININTDASKSGWGAVWGNDKSHGHWSASEQLEHINILELRAILFACKSFDIERNSRVKFLSDNTTAVQVINKMGSSRSVECNNECFNIWKEAIRKGIDISASFIPGKKNDEADKESRRKESSSEWKLNPRDFEKVMKYFGVKPDIDLFASRLNYQIKPFVSFRPDPESLHVNSFLIAWSKYTIYAFPPFNQICKTLLKIHMEKAKGVIIVPDWPNQIWYTRLKQMAKDMILLPHRKDLLLLPSTLEPHPLHKCLSLLAVLV